MCVAVCAAVARPQTHSPKPRSGTTGSCTELSASDIAAARYSDSWRQSSLAESKHTYDAENQAAKLLTPASLLPAAGFSSCSPLAGQLAFTGGDEPGS
mmetsp:Transcript_28352/g.68529  ORF Transcript_28352/g.68529 Transcript_28352/m.68529 type:complete len:98 (+) Transcript_28352:3349-3642(+)